MKITIFFVYLFLIIQGSLLAQYSGNSAYSKGNRNTQAGGNILSLDDKNFLIQANVLFNGEADGYIAVFGLAEADTSLKACNERIDSKIRLFTNVIYQKMSIPISDMYVDMTTQTKIYDYHIDHKENIAEQYLKGFEIKKNVSIKLKNSSHIDSLLLIAADYQIYDLIKVDYIVNDIEKVYEKLFEAAVEVINRKKNLYLKATHAKLKNTSQVYSEKFNSQYPSDLYEKYTASESSLFSTNDRNFKRKDLRKEDTYYYDKPNYAGFDKVITPFAIQPLIAHTLLLQIKFQIK
jgi:hypothetical protein